MPKAVQQRTIETRTHLLAAASQLIEEAGYEALRIEDVVLRAGVAKGTFFAHFRDKDTLMDLIVGARIDAHLDRLEAVPPPRDVAAMVDTLMPLVTFMGCERYVFDVILRRSGARTAGDIGPIATAFERYGRIVGGWFYVRAFRKDVAIEVLAEGVQGLITQALTLNFCAVHNHRPLNDRILDYLQAWLTPTG